MFDNIDFTQPSLWVSAASIAFNPTFWNIAAQSGTTPPSSVTPFKTAPAVNQE
jgi:hypothetical protein